MLGEGGVEWRPEEQAVVALPPLNMNLARYLVIQGIKQRKIRARSALRPLDIVGLSQLLVGFKPDCRLPGNSASGYPSAAGFRQ